jgi:tetrahydromethanopterin S-methyltransferase subunit G
MARDFEQLSAALAQNSKYTEVLKRQSNIERRVEKLENANH